MLRCLPLLLVLLLCTCDRAQKELPAEEEMADVPNVVRYEHPADKPVRMILDSDTANEIDDLFAIAYVLTGDDPKVNLLGISSAQWFHVWSGDSTVYQSQKMNEDLVALSGRTDLPLPLGSDLIMGKPWGDYDARESPAARFIIEQAHATPAGEKLAVLSIGAATNLASALALDSTITDKIVAYTLGYRYDFDGGFWNKDEFNIRRDLNAANYLLNAKGLELHVMPISVAIKYAWDMEETFTHLEKAGPMGPYLRNRWETNATDQPTRIMWDVALLQAFLDPELADEIAVLTPPENTQRGVWIYTDIDEKVMAEAYWARVEK